MGGEGRWGAGASCPGGQNQLLHRQEFCQTHGDISYNLVVFLVYITKTRLFKYIENFTTKN